MPPRKAASALSTKTVTLPEVQSMPAGDRGDPRVSRRVDHLTTVTLTQDEVSSTVSRKRYGRSESDSRSLVRKDDAQLAKAEVDIVDEQLRRDFAVLRRAAAELAQRKTQDQATALLTLASSGGNGSFEVVSRSLEDPSAAVRQAAARALYQINPEGAASFFNSALRDGNPERRRVIGTALAGTTLPTEAIDNLSSTDSRTTYRAFSLLFLLAKAGQAQPLMHVIEHHPNITLRLAMIALLASSGEAEVLPGLHSLVTRQTLPNEVRAAVMAAVDEIIYRNAATKS